MDNSTTTSTADGLTEARFPITPAAVILPTLALFTLMMDFLPFVWHIRNRNLAASSLIFYILFANLFNLINPFIWPTDDTGNWWSGFGVCDLEVKLMLGIWVGVVSSLLCILRTLARVLDADRPIVNFPQKQRTRRILIECLLCFGAPVYMMAVHYLVQSNRYYIFAISGCTTSFDESWPSLVLVFIWPPIFCIANLYYAVLVMIRMHRYRANFSAILASSSSDFSKNRFMRLFWMAFTLVVGIFPVECFVLYKNAANRLSPYSWSRIHGLEAWTVTMVPTHGSVSFDRWAQIGSGILVFIFFGMGQDAMRGYKKTLLKIGFGRIFPSLSNERPLPNPMGSRGSHSSRVRLYVARNAPFTKKSIVLTSIDSNSLHSSPCSPTMPTSQPTPLPTVVEVDAMTSEFTALPTLPPDTKHNEKYQKPSASMWTQRFPPSKPATDEQCHELAGAEEAVV